MTLLSCWILIMLLNFDTFLSRNSTSRRYVDGSKSHVELWLRVKIPRWIMTPGQNSTLNCDPNPRSQFNLGSQFNVESRHMVTIQRGIMTRGHNSAWNLDPGHNSTCNNDPGSQFNVELWPGVTLQRGIMTPGQNFTLNYDPGHSSSLNWDPNPGSQLNVESWIESQFNVELGPGVIIQRWIKTRGHNSTGGQNFIRRRGRNTMTPYTGGGRNLTWKIRWILSTARLIKIPRVEIQWGQNSILHRLGWANKYTSITSIILKVRRH